MSAGYGDVGKGCAQSLRGQGCARDRHARSIRSARCRPLMEGFEVKRHRSDVVETADIFVTTTGNFHVITADHMARMKDKAIVGNIGHFDNEIDMAGLEEDRRASATRTSSRPVRRVDLPRRPLGARPRRGSPAEPGLRHRPPELRDERLLHQSGAGPARALARTRSSYEKKVYVLPKALDEEVARLHLAPAGREAHRSCPRPRPSTSGCPIDGPYKPEHYRY